MISVSQYRGAALLAAAGTIGAFAVSAPPARAERAELLSVSPMVISSLGDLDNDKDLDLLILHASKGRMFAYLDGDTDGKMSHQSTAPSNAVDMCLMDVTSPAQAGPDGFLDVIVLTCNKSTDENVIHVLVNEGKESNGEWRGLDTGPTVTLPNEHTATNTTANYDAIWCGQVVAGDGTDFFVYDRDSTLYTAGKNKGVAGGVWQNFDNDSVFRLTDEAVVSVADQGETGVSFVMLKADGDHDVKKYVFGTGLQ